MRCKIYTTDEGFGPLVRQSAVVEALAALRGDLRFTLQTHRHLAAARWIFNGIDYTDRYNNITWDKLADGSPDLLRIRESFGDYIARSDQYIDDELAHFDYDFVLSDFVYEAFAVAQRRGVPAFGIAHFTWDWFFSKLYPMPLQADVLERFYAYADLADVLYFPPFTPPEILHRYRDRACEVPLVVRKRPARLPALPDDGRFKVLVMGSGSRVLHEQMGRALAQAGRLPDFHFFAAPEFVGAASNVTGVAERSLFVDYIPHVDLVIARAGFNTISECLAYRTPVLLVGEAINPEMSANMMNVKSEGLGSFLSLRRFTDRLADVLPDFVRHEYPSILHAMQSHDIPTDGARVIAEDILARVSLQAAVDR